MVALSIKRLIDVCTDDIVATFFLPMVETMHQDRVANIRFNVAQIVVKLLPRISREVFDTRIGPIITTLTRDADRDVVFFARKAQDAAAETFQ